MACREGNGGGLRLNIKANNENLLPTSQKFNTGSLRVPADPSWPKIPHRRLVDDAGDVIEPPCVITLTGTPCVARTVVARPLHPQAVAIEGQQPFRQKISTNATHALKRRPGCIDPRFKKVTIVKSQAAPASERANARELNDLKEKMTASAAPSPEQTKSLAEEVEKTVPERDITDDQREVQDESRESENVQNLREDPSACDADAQILSTAECNVKKSADEMKDSVCEKLTVPDGFVGAELDKSRDAVKNTSDISTKKENEKQITTESCDVNFNNSASAALGKDRNGQIFVMIKENVQSLPIGAMKIDQLPISSQQCATQYYNVQVPILTYQNVPIRISPQIQNETNPIERFPDTIGTEDSIRNKIQNEYKSLLSTAHPVNSMASGKSVATEYARAVHDDKKKGAQDARLSSIEREMPAGQNEGLNNAPRNKEVSISLDKQYSNEMKIFQPRQSHNDQCLKSTRNDGNIDKNLDNDRQHKEEARGNCCRLNDKEDPISHRTTVEMNRAEQETTGKESLEIHGSQASRGNVPLAQRELKSEECLARTRSAAIGKPCRISESRMLTNRRKISSTRSKKVKSFFRKKCRSNVPDSDYALIWPGYQRVKQKHSQYYLHKILGQRGDRCHGMKQYAEKKRKKKKSQAAGSCVSVSRAPKKALCAKFYRDSLRRTTATESDEDFKAGTRKAAADSPTSNNTEELAEHPTTIPFETQQLLNKSYWEYYNKLKNGIDEKGSLLEKYSGQISMGAPQLKKKRRSDDTSNLESHAKLSLPEIRTLEQCTVLSSMINKTLNTNVPRSADTSQTKQLYLNGNVKSSSDPTAGTRSAIVGKIPTEMPKKTHDDSPLSVNNGNKFFEETADNRLLNFKTAVFFGSVMYILIVFLPMIYDYVFFEEYEDYEDLGYVELAVEYVLSSFQEAFGGIFDVFGKIFFRTRTCRKCKSIA